MGEPRTGDRGTIRVEPISPLTADEVLAIARQLEALWPGYAVEIRPTKKGLGVAYQPIRGLPRDPEPAAADD